MPEWRNVPGFRGYQVSNDGQVLTLKRGAFRTLTDQPDRGYRRVTLFRDGRGHHIRVHQLVAAAFLGPAPAGTEVRHLDGVRDHNTVSNLEHGTSSRNSLDAVDHGTHNMARKTHCLRGHEFTPANTRLQKLRTGSLARVCKTCAEIRRAASRARLQAKAAA